MISAQLCSTASSGTRRVHLCVCAHVTHTRNVCVSVVVPRRSLGVARHTYSRNTKHSVRIKGTTPDARAETGAPRTAHGRAQAEGTPRGAQQREPATRPGPHEERRGAEEGGGARGRERPGTGTRTAEGSWDGGTKRKAHRECSGGAHRDARRRGAEEATYSARRNSDAEAAKANRRRLGELCLHATIHETFWIVSVCR